MEDNETPRWLSDAEFTFTEQLNRNFLCTRTKDGKQCHVRHSHGVWESASAEGERNAETGVYEWNWIASPVAGASESREGAAYAYFYYAHTPGGEFHDPNSVKLMDADTAEPIGPATPEQIDASNHQSAVNNGTGIILISADGTPIADGTWEASQPGVRRVYTERHHDF